MNETITMQVAQVVRKYLLEVFPDSPDLKHKCKYGSMLLHQAFKYLYKAKVIRFKPYPVAGYIGTSSIDTGHVWLIAVLNKKQYILDITLTQFASQLQKPIPDIIFGLRKDMEEEYRFIYDCRGEYQYNPLHDLRPGMVDEVIRRIQSILSITILL